MLDRINNGPNIDRFIQRITDPQLAHPGFKFGIKRLGDRLMHQQPRPRATDLSLIEPNCINQPLDSRIQIGVIKYDIGRFATQFQTQRLALTRCCPANFTPDLSRASKGDFVNRGMGYNHFPNSATTGNNINHTLWHPGLTADLGKQQCGQRGIFGRL